MGFVFSRFCRCLQRIRNKHDGYQDLEAVETQQTSTIFETNQNSNCESHTQLAINFERTSNYEATNRDDHDQEWVTTGYVYPMQTTISTLHVPNRKSTEQLQDGDTKVISEAASNFRAPSPLQVKCKRPIDPLSMDRPYYNKFDHTEPLYYETFDQNGGVLISKDGDLKLTIPKGAIKNHDLVKLTVAISLYGPFVLPSKCQSDVVSPYYWIGAGGSYHFQKPIQVELEHYGACDPSHYQLLCRKDDDESYTMQPVDCELSFTERIDNTISLCKFQTYHFCSYCLSHACKDPMINTIGAYFLKPQKYSDQFTVEVWFSFPISHCLMRNEELYKKKGMVLDEDCSCIFEASSDINSTAYFVLDYHNQGNDSWVMQHCRFKDIEVKQVNFYNYITNMQDLKAKEEMSLFPPRFIVKLKKKSTSTCCEDLDINITVTICKTDSGERKSAEFKLFVSASAINNDTVKCDHLIPVGCQCNKINKPNLKELIKYSEMISPQWKRIALH